jgi:hypothetical protein
MTMKRGKNGKTYGSNKRRGFGTNAVKAIPLQAWTGPEGFRRLRLPHFKTIVT